VWEKQEAIGGQWRLAAVPPGKADFLPLLSYYEERMAQAGVELILGKPATPEETLARGADAVIIASGAQPVSEVPFPCETVRVLQAWEVLAGAPVEGSNILVVGGGSVGCETALYLAEQGALDADTAKFMLIHEAEPPDEIRKLLLTGSYKITIVEQQKSLARDMNNATRWLLLKNLDMFGVNIYTQASVEGVSASGATLRQDDAPLTIKADTVVLALGARADNALYEALTGQPDVYLLGDARRPGKVHEAIHEAHKLACSL
jgi:2,4-dienoyl-CoA reductase (NADPH2)